MNQQLIVPKLTVVNKVLIITSAVIFLFQSILPQLFWWDLLALSWSLFSKGHVYQLFLYPLFFQSSFFSLLFNSLMIWFLGSELEAQWGSKRYFFLLLTSTLVAGIVFLLLQIFLGGVLFLSGLQGVGYALILIYSITFSDRLMLFMFFFPMKARNFCLLLLAVELYSSLSTFLNGGWMLLAHLTSMLGAWLFLKVSWYQYQRSKAKKAAFQVIPGGKVPGGGKKPEGPYWH